MNDFTMVYDHERDLDEDLDLFLRFLCFFFFF